MNRLRLLRETKGITQAEFAKIMNAAPSSVSCWEIGTNEMDYSTLIKAANYYGTSVDYIIGREAVIDRLTEEEKSIITAYRNSREDVKKAPAGMRLSHLCSTGQTIFLSVRFQNPLEWMSLGTEKQIPWY
ncbi:hypothetical protein SDC9_114505 [bioreactor metagenome]|uniref:HTH cro/C1-type domain-containing protein n=1 Tax=bioreactor metagenome TaxID=1076179 RepID=A0A645BQU8_9ZZZZ